MVVPAVAVSAMFAAVGQRAAEDPITPVSAPPTKKGGWQPVSTFQGLIGISGGFCRKPLGAQSIEWTSGNKTHRFVEISKNAEWFLKGVGGAKTQKGDLKAVTVLDEIRDKLNSTAADDGRCAEPSAVVGPSAVADGDDDDAPDSMDALDEVPDTPLKATKKAARTPQKKTARSMVTELQMPQRPLCVGSAETTTVWMYLKPNNRNIKSASIYIRVDCIDWLLAYAADELFYQGVKRDTAADEDLKVANCPAVADVNLEWDFTTHAWEAEFVTGPFQGVTRSFGTADLTTERLAKLRDEGIGQPEPSSPASALLMKKQLAKEFITLWCEAICNERDSFATEWGLPATVGNTSTATKRRRVAS